MVWASHISVFSRHIWLEAAKMEMWEMYMEITSCLCFLWNRHPLMGLPHLIFMGPLQRHLLSVLLHTARLWGSLANQKLVHIVGFCLFQVTQDLPATGKMAETESKVPQERQEFLGCLGPRGLRALLVSVSQPLAPCSLVKEHSVKGLTSESLSIPGPLHKPRPVEQYGGEAISNTGAKTKKFHLWRDYTSPTWQSDLELWCYSVSPLPCPWKEDRTVIRQKSNSISFQPNL